MVFFFVVINKNVVVIKVLVNYYFCRKYFRLVLGSFWLLGGVRIVFFYRFVGLRRGKVLRRR